MANCLFGHSILRYHARFNKVDEAFAKSHEFTCACQVARIKGTIVGKKKSIHSDTIQSYKSIVIHGFLNRQYASRE